MSNFSRISSQYEQDSIVQKSAGEILFGLLDIQPSDNVLDLGCGTGHISSLIKKHTSGNVVGVDQSVGMIKKAQEKYADLGLSFRNLSVEQLDYKDEFEIIFCNSVLQWFTQPDVALKNCYNALKYQGKMAVQAPATDNYCPNFIQAIEDVKRDKRTQQIFSGFNSPWLFFNSADDYQKIFEAAGFKVRESTIDRVKTSHSVEETVKIFSSGAAAGYLNQKYYTTRLTDHYLDAFKDIVRNSFQSQANESGNVELTFYRIYLLAEKIDT
ncbi:methyltransferase domain-containing protein [Thermodesulfobacteriota bacterium]